MRKIEYSIQFKRDYRMVFKRGYDIRKLEKAVSLLRQGGAMPREYRDHAPVRKAGRAQRVPSCFRLAFNIQIRSGQADSNPAAHRHA